jgi:hypothetical protein
MYKSAANLRADIQCGWPVSTGWTRRRYRDSVARMMPPRPPRTVVKLADHFGQYVLTLTCAACAQTLARVTGWDALLADVVKRMRCSKCGKRQCSVSVQPETKRDG